MTVFLAGAVAAEARGSAPEVASIPSCEWLLASRWTKPFDYLVRRRMTEGPVYRDERFDVRLIMDPSAKPAYSASRLVRATVDNTRSALEGLAALGFEPRAFIHVLAVADRHVLKERSSSGGWKEFKDDTHVSRGNRIFGLKVGADVRNLVGSHSVEDGHAFMILTDFSDIKNLETHAATSPVVIAHEVSHLTDPRLSFVWQEARADILAYLVTGRSELSHEIQVKVLSGFEKNRFVFEKSHVLRSLTHPRIRSTTQVVPHFAAQHDNSQILSSALYTIGQTFGREALVKLVHFLDESRCQFGQKEDATVGTDVMRAAYYFHLRCLADHVRSFGSRHALNGIGAILRSHGL